MDMDVTPVRSCAGKLRSEQSMAGRGPAVEAHPKSTTSPTGNVGCHFTLA